MKTIKNILLIFGFILITLLSSKINAQNSYKLNADTARFSAGFYMLAKTVGNTVYYTFDLSQYNTEFDNLYFKDFINKSEGLSFKTISYENGKEVVFEIDKKFPTPDVLHFFAVANKMTITEKRIRTESEKQTFIKNIKEPNQ